MEGKRRFGRRPLAWKGALLVGALLVGGCAQQQSSALTAVVPTAETQARATEAPTLSPTPTQESVIGPAATPEPTGTAPTTPTATPAPAPTPSPAAHALLRGIRLTRLPTTRKVVALTFDAGANADGVPSILRTLQATGTPATFFLTGKWVQTYPQLAQQIGGQYEVGNHTYSHPYLPQLSDTAVHDQISVAGTIIASATGHDPHPLFRFPYGGGDGRTIAIANELRYSCIQWTVDTQGWRGTVGGQSVDSAVARVMANLQPGEIVLMHVGSAGDRSTLDADALPRMIAALKAQGYSFTAVGDAL